MFLFPFIFKNHYHLSVHVSVIVLTFSPWIIPSSVKNKLYFEHNFIFQSGYKACWPHWLSRMEEKLNTLKFSFWMTWGQKMDHALLSIHQGQRHGVLWTAELSTSASLAVVCSQWSGVEDYATKSALLVNPAFVLTLATSHDWNHPTKKISSNHVGVLPCPAQCY